MKGRTERVLFRLLLASIQTPSHTKSARVKTHRLSGLVRFRGAQLARTLADVQQNLRWWTLRPPPAGSVCVGGLPRDDDRLPARAAARRPRRVLCQTIPVRGRRGGKIFPPSLSLELSPSSLSFPPPT